MSQGIQKYDPDFLLAVAGILNDEGGYVDNPADPGGETNLGISKRSYPDEDIKGMTAERATEIYWDRWMVGGFYRLKGVIAIKVFNLSIVMGPKPAVTCLQRALRACWAGSFATPPIYPDDGVLDLHTSETANLFVNVAALLAALRSEAAAHFRIVDAIHHQTRGGNHPFLKGWLSRAYS